VSERVVDLLTDETGFSYSDASFRQYNEIPEFVAGWQEKSLMFQFQNGGYCEKTLSTPVSVDTGTGGDDYIVFSCWTDQETATARKKDDFIFSVDFGSGRRYFQPKREFIHIAIPAVDSTITKIKFEYHGTDIGILLVSYMVVVKENIPKDIFASMVTAWERENIRKFLGTISLSQDDETFLIVDSVSGRVIPSIIRNSVFQIDDGVNSEIHNVKEFSNGQITLGDLFDGTKILHDYTDAPIYLYYYGGYGHFEKTAVFPSIIFWGMSPEPVVTSNEEERVLLSASDAVLYYEEKRTRNEKWAVQAEIDAHYYESISEMSRILRDILIKRELWCNGVKLRLDWDSEPTENDPQDPIDIIPRLIYTFEVEVNEAVWKRITTVPLVTQTLTIDQEKSEG
jgi:hypothetical protein